MIIPTVRQMLVRDLYHMAKPKMSHSEPRNRWSLYDGSMILSGGL